MITDAELTPTGVARQVKMVRMPSGARKQVVFRLTNPDGAPVELKTEVKNPPAAEATFKNERPVSELDLSVRLTAKVDFTCPQAVFDVEGKALDDAGVVEFALTEDNTCRPGIYLAQVGQFMQNKLIQTWPVYVLFEPTMFQTLTESGPLTIPEIRLALDDLEEGEVSLLDDVEFSDVQIAHAMRRAVDLWNETQPTIQPYNTNNFPYRYHWTIGTVAYLLDAAAAKFRRNRLSYNAGGVSVDDQNKSAEYQQIADAKRSEYRDWMMREKYKLNMDATWANF